MAVFLARIGALSARHRWTVLITWLVIIAGVVVTAGAVDKPFTADFAISNLASLNTLDTVDATFGGSHSAGDVVFAAPKGETLTTADRADVARLSSRLERIPGVTAAPDPFTASSGTLSPGGRIGYLPISLTGGEASAATQKAITSAIHAARSGRLKVEAASGLTTATDGGSTKDIGIVLAFVILLITFGALLAAGLPLVVAILGLVLGTASVDIATAFTTLNSTAPVLATLLGLAVGIDYSLFIVARHRRHLAEGMDVRASIALATGTAGTAVFFAALTVIIALAGLAVVHIGFLTAMGLCGAFAVLVAMLMALTLTPALLGIIGPRALSRRQRRRVARAERRPSGRLARRWSGLTTRHPVPFIVASVLVLAVVATPLLTMRVGLPTDGSNATSTTERKAWDLLADGFGAGINGPILVLATYPGGATAADARGLAARVGGLPDVATVLPAQTKGGDVLLTVLPTRGPSSASTTALVTRLRSGTTADGLGGGPRVSVTGETAVDIDISDKVASALPLYLALVAGFAFLLLMVVFRSILIPIKATISFLLSLGASLGGVVAVFQWGWFAGPLGVVPGPLLSFLPIIVTGVLFGLSMDYEMFLVSGIRERHLHGDGPRDAVVNGFVTGAQVVAAAGLIMIGVFSGGALPGDPTSQPIAFALALGVLLDAFVVRMTLVPAVLALFGGGAWWLPRWLERVLPRVDFDGEALQAGLDRATSLHGAAAPQPVGAARP